MCEHNGRYEEMVFLLGMCTNTYILMVAEVKTCD